LRHAVLCWACCRVLNLGAKGSTSTHCEADVHDAIGATWDTHDNILVAQLYNKFSHIDMRRPLDKGKKRPVEKLSIGGGDEVSGSSTAALGTAHSRKLSTRHTPAGSVGVSSVCSLIGCVLCGCLSPTCCR
jgi:hypothetical protein